MSSSWPSPEKAAVRTAPLILRSPTHCRERRLTSGTQPSLPRKATRGLSGAGQAAKVSRLFSGLPTSPATFAGEVGLS